MVSKKRLKVEYYSRSGSLTGVVCLEACIFTKRSAIVAIWVLSDAVPFFAKCYGGLTATASRQL